MLRRFQGQIDDADIADITSTVILRLLRRLRDDPNAIASINDFAAKLTYNAAYDFLRRRFPERTRHKNRLRYVLLHDERLAMWNTDAGTMTGLAQWRDSTDPPSRIELTRDDATKSMLDRNAPGDALYEIFEWNGQPLLLNDLAHVTAELWLIAEAERTDASTAVDTARDVTVQLEQKQYVAMLWREISSLRVPQRIALLLNLRDSDGANALSLLLLTGAVAFDDLAVALQLPSARLKELWPRLPLNDLSIAEMLGVTRQQVINLRRSARERLGRRMNMGSG